MPESLQDLVAATVGAASAEVGGADVTYRLHVGTIYVPAQGKQVVSYHDVALRGVAKEGVDVDDVSAGTPGLLQVGDVRYTFPTERLAGHLAYAQSGDVSTSDVVVEAGVAHSVVGFSRDGNGAVLVVFARRRK